MLFYGNKIYKLHLRMKVMFKETKSPTAEKVFYLTI